MMLTAQDLEPEFEQCPYCGVTCENPCDSLPSGPCEQAHAAGQKQMAEPKPDVCSAKAAFESEVRLGNTHVYESYVAGYEQGMYDECMRQGPSTLTPLQQDASNLLFALHDAWPYVHQWATIKSVKDRIGALMRKHGDFADIHAELDAKATQPVTGVTMFTRSELDTLLKQIGYYANERAIEIVEAAVVAKFQPEGHQYRTWYSEPDNCWSAWRTLPQYDFDRIKARVDAGVAEVRPLFSNRLSVTSQVATTPTGELTDEQIDAVVLQQTGFDGYGTQAMNNTDIRRIVRAAGVAPEVSDPTHKPGDGTSVVQIVISNDDPLRNFRYIRIRGNGIEGSQNRTTWVRVR